MAGDTSKENGKKGGRPLSHATLLAQETRKYIAERVSENNAPIVAKAITQAIEGDKYAREWLYDRGFGRSEQVIDLSTLGEPINSLKDLSDAELAAIAGASKSGTSEKGTSA